VTDARVRQQFQRGVQHAETRAKYGHDDDVLIERGAIGRLERRVHGRARKRQIARRFENDDEAEPTGEPTEQAGGRRAAAERRQSVLGNRVTDEVDAHVPTTHSTRIARRSRAARPSVSGPTTPT
jgi:hypothetical protein